MFDVIRSVIYRKFIFNKINILISIISTFNNTRFHNFIEIKQNWWTFRLAVL